jgi:hypothetical protein
MSAHTSRFHPVRSLGHSRREEGGQPTGVVQEVRLAKGKSAMGFAVTKAAKEAGSMAERCILDTDSISSES